MAKNIYVGNLSYSTEEPELENLFAQYGTVTSVRIITDRYTNQSKGFGFVEMADDNAADAAMTALNGSDFDGRNLKVNEARERDDRRRGGGGGGGGDRY